ncbi:hypothetical protein JYU20_00525 [Bacteroidales bacterium AH-315-I05]|nr:hypothetical protein [Bacteroidales bacterium AH-315-I05]
MPVVAAILKNRWFWIAVVILIALILLNKYGRLIKVWLSPIRGDFQPGGITDKRKQELEDLASVAHSAIYSSTGNISIPIPIPAFGYISGGETDVEEVLNKINTLNDNELYYVANYYKKSLTKGNSLYKDIDDEWMPFVNIDEKLMARLTELSRQ